MEAAELLGKDFPFVRVDLYDCGNEPRFGELTFWPEGGLCRFSPASYDAELGAWLADYRASTSSNGRTVSKGAALSA